MGQRGFLSRASPFTLVGLTSAFLEAVGLLAFLVGIRLLPLRPRSDTGLHGVAAEINGIGEELGKLYPLESISDHLADIANALRTLADATALSVIANNGTEEDRATAVTHLKR